MGSADHHDCCVCPGYRFCPEKEGCEEIEEAALLFSLTAAAGGLFGKRNKQLEISSLHSLQMEGLLSIDLGVDLGQTHVELMGDSEQLTDGSGKLALALFIQDFLAFDLGVYFIQAYIRFTGGGKQLTDSSSE